MPNDERKRSLARTLVIFGIGAMVGAIGGFGAGALIFGDGKADCDEIYERWSALYQDFGRTFDDEVGREMVQIREQHPECVPPPPVLPRGSNFGDGVEETSPLDG